MSTTIDERVLEMRFDNRQFENNVSNTMSTLDKLKQKLNFTGASKGLESVNAAAKNVNMTGLGSAVETVSAKFSALQVIGVTALANITNSAVNAGKRIVSALTIDPVKTGFQEYETQINAVQTILANTSSKGTTIDDVNRALEQLNAYADKTIYNFTEMTRNIGTFTAAGVDLDTSVNAIQGIANLAAVSGSTSQQASTAMYQLSQALASGTVKLMDWNSVVNAGMGGEVFQNALKETARVHGVAIDSMIDKQGSFRETLSEGWLTSEILTETLQKFTLTTEGLTEAQIESNREMLRAKGYTDDQIEEIFKLGKTATDAATKVKTFTQLWDVLKESAQSGWSQTWKIIVGDFEEAKSLLTPLADTLTGFINRMSDWRNTILEFALDFTKPWKTISEKLAGAGLGSGLEKIEKMVKGVGDLTDKLEYYQDVVNKVWRGDYKNADTGRYGLLEKAGYDHRVVQDLVNKGYQYKLTVEDIEESHKKFGLTMDKTSKSSKQTAKAFDDTSTAVTKLSDEQLKNAGLTEEEIDLYRALEKEAARTGVTIEELTKKMSEKDGRTLLIDAFKNIGTGIKTFASTIKNAWVEIFNPPGVGELAIKLYGIIGRFNEFTKKLTLVDAETGEFTDTAKKLQKTFEGIFAIVDIITTVAGGGLKIAFKVLNEILSHFDLNILDVTAAIAEAIIGFRDWIDSVIDVGKAVGRIIPAIQDAVKAVKEWLESLKTSENLPADIISGLINGLRAGVGMVWDAAVALAKGIVDAIKSFLGIHSPSTVMAEIGKNTVDGLINGLSAGIGKVVEVAKTIVGKIVKIFKSLWDFVTDEGGNVEWGKIFAGGVLISMVWFLKQIATAISGISETFGGLGDVLENAARVMKSFSKVLNGYAWDLKAKALQKLAIAVAILVGAIVILAQIEDVGKLWNAIVIVGVLAGILVGLAWAMDKLCSVNVDFDGKKIEGLKTGLMQIGLVMLMLAATVKIIGDMDPTAAKRGFKSLAGIAVGMVVFMAALGGISRYSKDLGQIGGMMLKLSIAMMLMVGVVKMVGGLDNDELAKGILFAAGFVIFVNSITKVAKSAGKNVNKVGGMMVKLSIAMGLMVGVVKLVSTLSGTEMLKGVVFAAGFAVFLKLLVSCTKIGKKQQIAKLGGLVLSVSFSLTLLVGVCKLVGMLHYQDMIKGAVFVAGFVGMLKILVSVLSIGSEQQMAKVSGTILAMSLAIAILAGVAVALSFVDLGGLAKGVAAVGLLSLMVMGMVKALKGANNVMGSLIVMTVAIAVMASAIVALSMIDDTSKLQAAAGALSIVMGMFALIAKCSNNINKAAGSLVAMTIAVGALAGILWLLTNNVDNADNAIKVATSLAILMTTLAVSFKIVSGLKTITASAIGAMAGMVIILAGLVGIFGMLSAFDIEPSIEAATALSILLLALAGVTAILTVVDAGAPAVLGGIAAFAIVVVGVGLIMAALHGLTKLFPGLQSWLDTGIDILGQIGTGIGKFVGGIIGGIGEGMMDSALEMVGTFGEIVDKLVEISDKGTSINTEGFDGIGKLIEALAGIALTSAGMTITDIFTKIFGDGQTTMEKFQADAVAFFDAMKAIGEASTGVTIDAENLDTIVKAGKKLADLQSCIEPIGGLASYLVGHTDLSTFGTSVAGFIESMKTALDSLWGYQFDAQTFDQVIAAAGSLAKLQSSLEPIDGVVQFFKGREDLSTFGVDVAGFIESMKTALSALDGFQFDHQTFDEIIAAAGTLAKLQSSLEPIDGVIQFFTGRDDLSTFGVDIAAFITSMKTALATLEGTTLNEEALASVITAAEKLAALQSQLEPMGGVISWFAGRTDLGTFGVNIGLFADAMGKLKTAMGENGITEDAIASITNAGTAIIELQKALPEEGWFDGKMNLSEFSDYVTDFGTAMATFGESAAGIDSAAVNTSINTANRIKSLIESLVGLDTSGLATFTGIGTGGFGADGAAYKIGKAISAYSEEVAGIDTGAVSTSVSAATKLKSLIAGLVGLDATGVENFKIEAIGKQMGNYANRVKNLDGAVVSSSISAANRLKNFISSLTGIDTSGIANFKVESIGKAMRSYGSSVSGLNSSAVSSSISAATRLKNFVSSLAGLNTSGVGSFKTAIKELSTVNVSEMVRAFTGASEKLAGAGTKMIEGLIKGMKSKIPTVKTVVTDLLTALNHSITSKSSTFQQAGAALMAKFATGLSSRKAAAKSAISACIASAVSSLRSYYSAFYSAGSYLVSGFAAGISANSYKAAAKAAAMANAAERAARQALDINSPSKVFREIGMGIPEGFIQGIEKLSGSVDKSVYSMADGAISSVGNTISKLATLIESDVDSQPTIRPVLDLSDVRSGAATIGSLFDTNSAVGVLANVNTVGGMMRGYGQNGGNNDIIDAINKLRKDLGNVGNTYNYVDGVTYDDGSNIANAVKTITRAARMERRI